MFVAVRRRKMKNKYIELKFSVVARGPDFETQCQKPSNHFNYVSASDRYDANVSERLKEIVTRCLQDGKDNKVS